MWDSLYLFPLLLLLTSGCVLYAGTQRAGRSGVWWTALLLGAALAYLAGIATARPTGGLDFLFPLALGLALSNQARQQTTSDQNTRSVEFVSFLLTSPLIALAAYRFNPAIGRLEGVMGDPNLNGLMLLLPIVWGVSLGYDFALRSAFRWRLALVGPLLALLGALQAATLSRAAILASGVALIWYFALRMRDRRRLVMMAIIGIGLVALICVSYAPLRERLFVAMSGVDLSLRHRWIQMQAMLGLMAEQPLFGVGWHYAPSVWRDYLRPTNMNTTYGAAPWVLEAGIQAGVVMLWVLLSLVILGCTRQPRSSFHRVATASLLAISLAGLSQSFLFYPIINAIFFFTLGVCLSPGGKNDGRLLLHAHAVGGLCAAGLWLGGTTSLPTTQWQTIGDHTFVIRSQTEPGWVAVEIQTDESQKIDNNTTFCRHLAEVGGVYFRTRTTDHHYHKAAREMAVHRAAPLILIAVDPMPTLMEKILTQAPWKAVIHIQKIPVYESLNVTCEVRITHSAHRINLWKIDTPNTALTIPANRFLGALIAHILNLEAGVSPTSEPVFTPLITADPKLDQPVTGVVTSRRLSRLDRAEVANLIRAYTPDLEDTLHDQVTYLAWKVRDRFHRDIDPEIYHKGILMPPRAAERITPDWRKRYYFHFYPLVWGTPDEDKAIVRIVDDACWSHVVAHAKSPANHPIRTLADMAEHVTAACRAVGIAADHGNCGVHTTCVLYYNDNENRWKCAEVADKWHLLHKVTHLARTTALSSALR